MPNELNPNRVVLPRNFIRANDTERDITLEFYSNARELVINGVKYPLTSDGKSFTIAEWTE